MLWTDLEKQIIIFNTQRNFVNVSVYKLKGE